MPYIQVHVNFDLMVMDRMGYQMNGLMSSSATSTAKSIASIPSIASSSVVSPCKTPKAARRGSCSSGSKAAAASSRRGDERMITIKCQRMTADKICEEIEVEVRKCQNQRGNQNSCFAIRATLIQFLGFK